MIQGAAVSMTQATPPHQRCKQWEFQSHGVFWLLVDVSALGRPKVCVSMRILGLPVNFAVFQVRLVEILHVGTTSSILKSAVRTLTWTPKRRCK